ncbi:MAG TPA: sigma factor-like helix-turn-helix DNA-binding protein [Armatimonadota bacterium]|jgi:DNA-binding CsgD family transcriptional regulator
MFDNTDSYLEEQADQLLKESAILGKKTGIYTEKQLRRHTSREIVSTQLATSALAVAGEDLAALVLADLRHIGRLAKLTDRQQDAWNLTILGLNIREIAEACGISERAVRDRLNLARFKVIKAMVRYPYFGLWEVYCELIRRR